MKRISAKLLEKGKWLGLHSCDYKAVHPKTGEEFVKQGYEYVQRTTTTNCGVDSATLVPFLVYPDGRRQLLLIANYRPPIDRFDLDPGEDPLVAAARELKEETGYTMTKIIED
jgi:ADP-ribose pyrophosphatase